MTTPHAPTKYTGPNQYLGVVVVRNRPPAGSDFRQPETGKYYPIGCVWQVGANPTSGTEGDLYMLSKIVANVAYWFPLDNYVPPSVVTWQQVSGTSQTIAVQTAYVPFNSSLTTFTLPTTAVFGDVFLITGYGSGGWTIAQGAGQSIVMGSNTSTTGVGGSIASTKSQDTLHVVCIVANTIFKAVSWTGNLTVI